MRRPRNGSRHQPQRRSGPGRPAVDATTGLVEHEFRHEASIIRPISDGTEYAGTFASGGHEAKRADEERGRSRTGARARVQAANPLLSAELGAASGVLLLVLTNPDIDDGKTLAASGALALVTRRARWDSLAQRNA